MARNFENTVSADTTDEFYIGGVLVRRGSNGEFATASSNSAADVSIVTANSPAYESISATRPVQHESEQLRAMSVAALTQEADVTKQKGIVLDPPEKIRQRRQSAARVVGKVVLYSTLFGLVPGLTGATVYNAGHSEHINGPVDIIPAITQTWHEAVAIIPFGGGK